MAVSVDTSQVEAAVRAFTVAKATELGDRFVDVVRQMAPRRSGELAASVEVAVVEESAAGARAVVAVGADYARFVNDGTGIYGPNGQPIKGNPLLAFDWPAAGGMVIVHSVRGSEPTHFWERALDAWPRVVGGV